ncbi:MAG: type II secretion system F family protein [Ilumatobacteraceae bacterium]
MTAWPIALVVGVVLTAAAAVRRTLPPRPVRRVRELSSGPAPQRAPRLIGRRRPGAVVRTVAVGVALLAVGGPFVAVAVLATWWAARRMRPVLAARRLAARVDRAVPDAIEMFVLTIHAGLSPVQAVRELAVAVPAEVRSGFAAVVHRLDRGEPFAQAVLALPERLGGGMVAFADLIAGADRYGVPIGPVLESLALDVRATRRRIDEADARRLPVRLSFPLVICTLPSFVLLAIAPALIAALSSLSLDL